VSNLIKGLNYPEKRQRNNNEEINNEENEVRNLTTVEQVNSAFNLTQWWACYYSLKGLSFVMIALRMYLLGYVCLKMQPSL